LRPQLRIVAPSKLKTTQTTITIAMANRQHQWWTQREQFEHVVTDRLNIIKANVMEAQDTLKNVSAQVKETSEEEVPRMQQQINQLQRSLNELRDECHDRNQQFQRRLQALEARLDNGHGGSSYTLSTGPPSTASSHPPSTVSAVSDHTLTQAARAAAAAAAVEQRMRSAQTLAAHVPIDMHPIDAHHQAREFCMPCIAAGVHTAYFNEWLSEDDINWIDDTCSTRYQGDYVEFDAYAKFCNFNNRLGSMLCGISSDGTKNGQGPICNLMEEAAAKGFFFCWGKHKTCQRSTTKANNASWVGCETCYAKLQIDHPGLPAEKMGRKAVERVNLAFTNFFFTEEEIRRNNFRRAGKCAIERMYPSSVLTNDDHKDWRYRSKPKARHWVPKDNGGEGRGPAGGGGQ